MLFELAAEMFRARIPALFGDLIDRAVRVLQFLPGEKKAVLDHIIHTGNPEPFLVYFLQVPRADVELFRHFGDAPWGRRVVFYVHAKLL